MYHASSSGGAAGPGGTRGQGVIPRRFKRKKIFVMHAEWMDDQTDMVVEIVM